MVTTADIKKAIDPLWHHEELQDLELMAQVLIQCRSPEFKISLSVMLAKIMVYVVQKMYSEVVISSTDALVDSNHSSTVTDKLVTFLQSLPEFLYAMAGSSHVFVELLPVLDVFDANFFESHHSGDQNVSISNDPEN
jgi:hypothetical protein